MNETLVHLNITTMDDNHLTQKVVDEIVKAAQQVIEQEYVEGYTCCPLWEEI